MFAGENLNSAATTKKQVLDTAKDFLECISKHLYRQYHLKKETREAVREHYEALIEDMKTGIGETFH